MIVKKRPGAERAVTSSSPIVNEQSEAKKASKTANGIPRTKALASLSCNALFFSLGSTWAIYAY